jgi:hypothetical protein
MKRFLLVTALTVLVMAAAPLARSAPAAPAPAAAPGVEAAPPEMVQMADDVARQVETMRGWKFREVVAKRVCTPEFVRAYLEKEVQKQCPPEKVACVQAFLKTVGLLPPEADLKKMFLDILQDQAGGFYDTETKTLYMVKRTAKSPPLVDRIMMAHELTHALDDQQVDIDKSLKPLIGKTEDMDLVTESVMEGSATALMTQYMARAQLSGEFDLNDLQAYAAEEARRSKGLLDAPRYFLSMVGAYMCGMQFLARGNILTAMLSGDNKAIGQNFLEAVKDPPRSMEQVLHGQKYWDPKTRDEPVVVSDDAAARLLARPGRWIVHKDTLGEMLCAAVTTAKDSKPNLMTMQMAETWTNAAATGWGGDRFFLLASGPSAEAAAKTLKDLQGVWITFWDTPKDREEFVEAYDKNAPVAHTTLPLGNVGAVILFGFSEADANALGERFEKSPPTATQGGKPWAPWAL